MLRKEIPPHIELGRVYRLDEFRSEWAQFLGAYPREYSLPTEVVLHKAEFLIPQQGRSYPTPFFVFHGRILNYDQLAALPGWGAQNFYLTYDHLEMAEVWSDEGEDGHIRYCLQGWRFIPYRTLELRDERWREIPAALMLQHFDWERIDAERDTYAEALRRA